MKISSIPDSPTEDHGFHQDTRLIALVGLAHMISHFSHLLLAPLFPWLKEAFHVSYAELGLLMSIFFAVSCVVQMLSGFAVDRFGPRPLLLAGLGLLALAAFGFSASTSYGALAGFSVLAGMGNGVFHPVDYTLLNRKVSALRLAHAYSVHGITGSLGWALAPALLVPIAMAFSWHAALVCAGLLICLVLVLILLNRHLLDLPHASANSPGAGAADAGKFVFLRIPAVWMCFAFFFFSAIALSVVQVFAPEAARQLHGMPLGLVAICLTAYMVCSAAGMVLGGFLAADASRCEHIVSLGYGMAACVALVLGLADVPSLMVPVLFGLMGFCAGTGGPSRDLIVKRSTPPHSTGRVYGVVYSGLDIGQAIAPLIFGTLMDLHQNRGVFIGLALVQAVLIATALNVGRVRRTERAAV